MSIDRPHLRGLSDIDRFVRQNDRPIHAITPMPFNVLGPDQWVGSIEYLNYLDIFEGALPRCFVPDATAGRS